MPLVLPNKLFCHLCGSERPIPTYWKNCSIARKNDILTRACKKCATGRKKTHGLGTHKIYMVWYNMMIRCGHIAAELPEEIAANYRDRGIKVCYKWQKLEPFAKWAFESGYSTGLTIDRINNDLGYYPSNCRWASYQEQANNTRRNRFVSFGGKKHTLAEWGRIFGTSRYQTAKKLRI